MTTSDTSKILDIHQIKQYLPHRYPMLLVDRVLTWESGKTITAIKNVTVNEEFFNGHFPHKPVMPTRNSLVMPWTPMAPSSLSRSGCRYT